MLAVIHELIGNYTLRWFFLKEIRYNIKLLSNVYLLTRSLIYYIPIGDYYTLPIGMYLYQCLGVQAMLSFKSLEKK